MARPNALLLSLLLIATVSVVALAIEPDCIYTLTVTTGAINFAGTDAVIGVTIADKSGQYVEIKDLERWGGKMGYDYFESGNVDIFSGNDTCLPKPVCFLTLTSDYSGNNPGWYVEYVDVSMAKVGSPSKRQHFSLEQWLAIDAEPYELTTERNYCPGTVSVGGENRKNVSSIV